MYTHIYLELRNSTDQQSRVAQCQLIVHKASSVKVQRCKAEALRTEASTKQLKL